MATAFIINDTTVILHHTPEEVKAKLVSDAVDLIMGIQQGTDEWEDMPYYETSGLGRNMDNIIDRGMNQRPNPIHNYQRRNKDRR